MKFRVTVLPRAQQDIAETYDFIAVVQQEPLVAERWVDGIEEAIQSLSSMPLRGRTIPEQDLLGVEPELRQIMFHSHRIIYTVQEDLVQVVHIRRGSRHDVGKSDLDE